MKRFLSILVLFLSVSVAVSAQYVIPDHDAARYNEMNRAGVWNVGIGIAPAVAFAHPLSTSHGGGRVAATGIIGVSAEGGWFFKDNMRAVVELSYANNYYGNMFSWNGTDSRKDMSVLDFSVMISYHFRRWSLGGGLDLGHTVLEYSAADTAEGGVNDSRLGSTSFSERASHFGLAFEGSFAVSPFLRLEGFYRPSLAAGAKYVHTLGAQIKIYFPFVDAVVCR